MSKKRNIVLITLDSVRADHCSFMGYHRKTTPTIDKMAKKGLYFENAQAASIATAPSMFTALTGEYPSLESNNYNPMDWKREISSKNTVAEQLSEQGYYTAVFSPNIAFSSYFGFSKGFDYFDDFEDHEKFRSHERFQKIDAKKFSRFFVYLYDIFKRRGGATPWEDLYGRILKKIRNLPEPYFVWILLLDTHFPYLPPKKYRIWGNLVSILYSNYLAYQGPCPKYLEKSLGKLINPTSIYDDCIYYSDFFIKELFEDLKENDPIFIIFGDHGEDFGEHGFYGHPPGYPVLLYEEFIHIPLVIYNGDVKGKIEEPLSLRQLPLMLLNLINNPENFSDNFSGGEKWAITSVLDRGKRKVAVRMKNWKFITGQKDGDELYNLKEDPYEQENLINEHPKLAEEMKKIVEAHIKHETEKMKISNRRQRLKLTK